MRKINIESNDSQQTLIKFLNKYLSKAPNSLLYKWIRKKKIKVNKKRVESNYKLKEGDILYLYIYDEELEKWTEDKKPSKSLIDVDIAFENSDVMIMDKDQNTLVHAADKSDYGKNLVDFMIDLMISKEEYIPRLETSFRPAIVNRLDRNTRGLVIGAKNRESLLKLNQEQEKISKFYLAIVHGKIDRKIEIENQLEKDDNNQVHVVKSGKKSKTIIRPIQFNDDYSLVEIELLTGRTHQIRVSLSDIGHPILGDRRYGIEDRDKRYKDQQLVAYKLDFSEDISVSSLKGKVVKSKYEKYIYNLYENLLGEING